MIIITAMFLFLNKDNNAILYVDVCSYFLCYFLLSCLQELDSIHNQLEHLTKEIHVHDSKRSNRESSLAVAGTVSPLKFSQFQ